MIPLETRQKDEVNMMAPFIARMIIKAANKSLEQGQAKYRAYFVKTHIYADYHADVDTILTTDGYEDCIVDR